MADFVLHFPWTYILALYVDDNYGNSGLDVIIEKIQGKINKTCISIAARLPIPVGKDSPDIR